MEPEQEAELYLKTHPPAYNYQEALSDLTQLITDLRGGQLSLIKLVEAINIRSNIVFTDDVENANWWEIKEEILRGLK